MILTHARCGKPVGLTVKDDDVNIYVYCSHCRDLVEEGELELAVDTLLETVRLVVDSPARSHKES